MKKGHRPPPQIGRPADPFGPKPGEPGWHEPYVEGFNGEAWERSESYASSEELRKKLFYRFKNEMDPEVIRFWADRGVRKEMFRTQEAHGLHRYSIHMPTDLGAGKTYPLIYYCHGGMQDPFQAECCGLSLLIPQERFIVVYANNGGFSNETAVEDFQEITDAMKERGYPVDWSRVYVAGFSSGSDAAESIATRWPELVAAVSPCPGSNAMYNSLCRQTRAAYEKCLPTRVPVLFIGGTADFGDRYPFPDAECVENFNIWAAEIAKVKDYRPITFEESRHLAEQSEDPAKRAVGLDFQCAWSQRFEGREWYFGDFYGAEGAAVVRFIIGKDVPHVVTGCHAGLMWDFFKHWSKDPNTGKSIYTPVMVSGVN